MEDEFPHVSLNVVVVVFQAVLRASGHALRPYLLPQVSGTLPGPQPQLPFVQGEPLRGEQWSFSRISHVRSIVYAVLNNVFGFFLPASVFVNPRLQQDAADGSGAAALLGQRAGGEEEDPRGGDEGALQVSFHPVAS